jgi:hypothetical protein
LVIDVSFEMTAGDKALGPAKGTLVLSLEKLLEKK